MNIRFIFVATLALNFTNTAYASFNFTDEGKSYVNSEGLAQSFHSTLSSQNTSSGTQLVQLVFHKNAVSAKSEMDSIQKQFKTFLKEEKSFVHELQNHDDVLNRLYVTGLSDINSAKFFCSKLKAENQDYFAFLEPKDV